MVGGSFAVYCRVSEQDGNGLSSDPAEQEAYARDWAARNGIHVAEVVTEVASGALAADDRKLGHLIGRCEQGELAGIIVRDEKRFARDVVAGGAALARLTDCGARLVATWTGFDSKNLTPEGQMVFNMLMAVGQAERERNRLRRIVGKENAASRGVWCSSVPVGYDRDDDGRLVPNDDAPVVREIFRRRAQGEGFSEIAAASLPHVTVSVTRTRTRERKRLTRSGVRRVVLNRAYLGEQRIPVKERRGEPKVLRDNHPPLVTETEWEAANAVKGRAPVRRGLGQQVLLKGLPRCGSCGARLHVLSYGKQRDKLTYACTRPGCGSVSMAAHKLEPAVLYQLDRAIAARDPYVGAVIEGDSRYGDALAEVTQKQTALAEYRDNVELQQTLGIADYTAGLRVRQQQVAEARRALHELPPPEPMDDRAMTIEEFDVEDRRRFYRRAIAEVLVFPRSNRTRLSVRWHGSEAMHPVPEFRPVDLATLHPLA